MTEEFAGGDASGDLEAQPHATRVPPGSPPVTAVAVAEPEPAGRRAWGLRDALPVILFLLFLASVSLGSVPEQPAPKVNVRALLVVQSLFYTLILFYIYSVVCLKYRLGFWDGLRWSLPAAARRDPRSFLLGGAGLAVFVQLFSLPVSKELPIERLFDSREAALLLTAFGVLVAPLVEEVIFRGFIFGALETAWGQRAAVWSTALLFAAIHVPQLRGGAPQILAILVVGFILAWARARTGAVAPAYLIHLAYNTTLFAMLYFATEGFRKFGKG